MSTDPCAASLASCSFMLPREPRPLPCCSPGKGSNKGHRYLEKGLAFSPSGGKVIGWGGDEGGGWKRSIGVWGRGHI